MGMRNINVRTPQTPQPDGNPVGVLIGLVAAVICIVPLVFAAVVTLNALSLTFSALVGSASAGVFQNLMLNAIAGVFAGVTIVVLRSCTRKPEHFRESFLSALFNKGLAAPVLDGVFLGRVLLGGAVGFAVGAVNGSSGTISFLHLFSDSTSSVFKNGAFPIVVFLGGGFGGRGGTDFWWLLLLVLVVILAALLVGFLVGFVLHVLVCGLAGMTKGGTKAYVMRILEAPSEHSTKRKEGHPIRTGMSNGLITGLIAGIIEAAFTAWAAANHYVPPKM